MNKQIKHSIATVSACLLLCLFLYTASDKLMNFAGFERVLHKSPLLMNIAAPVAMLVPVSEIAVGIFLFIPHYRSTGFLLSMVLLSLFTLYIVYMFLFTPKLPCSCGGVLKQLSWAQHLLFNLLCIVIGVTGYRCERRGNAPLATNSFLRKKQAVPKTCLNE